MKALWWGGGSAIASGVLYGLWWLHNDHPLLAAIAGGVLFMVQFKLIGTLVRAEMQRRDSRLIGFVNMKCEAIDTRPLDE